jgi:hypothetical protein
MRGIAGDRQLDQVRVVAYKSQSLDRNSNFRTFQLRIA